jgi:hypothetical protein
MKAFIIVALSTFALGACSSKTPKADPAAAKPADIAATPAPAASKAKKITVVGKGKAAQKSVDKSTEKSAETAPVVAGKHICTSGQDTRTLELKAQGDGCALDYTKAGETKTLATAASDKSYCEGVQEKVIKNLEGAGFACQ